MQDVYLTVDLDFFGRHYSLKSGHFESLERAQARAVRFMEKLVALGRPIVVFLEHHHVLRDLEGRRYARLINVDLHDDLGCWGGGRRFTHCCGDIGITCGNWTQVAPFRAGATYEWRYPSFRDARCCGEHGLANGWRENTGWQSAQHRRGTQGIPWERVDRVGISLSPDYVEFREVELALKFLATRGQFAAPRLVARALRRVARGEKPFTLCSCPECANVTDWYSSGSSSKSFFFRLPTQECTLS